MNADGKIYIIITDKAPGSGPGETPKPEEKKEKDKGEMLKHWARKKLLSEAQKMRL